LQDITKIGHPQLVPLQDPQEAEAHGVCEAVHPGEEGIGLGGDLDHPYIRINC
jgi:hypothetical protein